jgi:hypothetical protein
VIKKKHICVSSLEITFMCACHAKTGKHENEAIGIVACSQAIGIVADVQ